MSVKLWFANHTRATRPRWLLEEIGEPYELVKVDLKARAHKEPAYIEHVHPHGVVPAADIDGKHIIESGAIVAALADKYMDKGLCPRPDSSERAVYFQWLFYAQATIEPALIATLTARKPDSGVAADKKEEAEAQWRTVLGVLERGLDKRDWILGQRFQAVDCVLGSLLAWAYASQLVDASFANVTAYVDRCRQRPGFKAARKD